MAFPPTENEKKRQHQLEKVSWLLISELRGCALSLSFRFFFLHRRRIRTEITEKSWNSLGKLPQKPAMEEGTTETGPHVTMVTSRGRKGWG